MTGSEQNNFLCTACNSKLKAEQNYCSHCGQKIGKKKISVLSILTDTFGNYLSFERSGLSTIFHVLKNPSFIVDNYCNGNKGYFASPGKMIIFCVVLMALQITFVNQELLRSNFEVIGLNKEYGFFLVNFIFLVLASQLTFDPLSFKIARHFVSVTYTMTTILIVCLVFDNLCLLLGIELPGILLFIFMELVLLWNSFALTRKKVWWRFTLNFITENVILAIIILILIWLNDANNLS